MASQNYRNTVQEWDEKLLQCPCRALREETTVLASTKHTLEKEDGDFGRYRTKILKRLLAAVPGGPVVGSGDLPYSIIYSKATLGTKYKFPY